jgi:hypothetical protein
MMRTWIRLEVCMARMYNLVYQNINCAAHLLAALRLLIERHRYKRISWQVSVSMKSPASSKVCGGSVPVSLRLNVAYTCQPELFSYRRLPQYEWSKATRRGTMTLKQYTRYQISADCVLASGISTFGITVESSKV